MVRRDFLLGAAVASTASIISSRAWSGPFKSDRISVRTIGEGADIIFIPGLASHADVFLDLAKSLSHKFRSHLISVNGFAGIPAGANGTGPVMVPVAEEIVRYANREGLDRPALIGHSMGGAIGMVIAARHSAMPGRLMIIDMIPFAAQFFVGPDATPDSARSRAEEIAREVLSEPTGEIPPLLRNMYSGMTGNADARLQILQWLRSSDERVVAQSFREVITMDLRPELGRIKVPVTVVYVPLPGHTKHPFIRPSYATLPQVDLIEIHNSNHFVMFDQPGQMKEAIELFMTKK